MENKVPHLMRKSPGPGQNTELLRDANEPGLRAVLEVPEEAGAIEIPVQSHLNAVAPSYLNEHVKGGRAKAIPR
jgi:hypothetical protein